MFRTTAFFILLAISLSALGQSELSTKSKKAIELYTLADNFRVRGQFSEALNLLNQGWVKERIFLKGNYGRGWIYFQLRNIRKRPAIYERE